jgi:enoyl-CoA hydratase/carnithine racemase
MAPNAVAGAKELVARAPLSPLAEHLEAERRHFLVNLFHDNGDEGLKAFFEKRLPVFR